MKNYLLFALFFAFAFTSCKKGHRHHEVKECACMENHHEGIHEKPDFNGEEWDKEEWSVDLEEAWGKDDFEKEDWDLYVEKIVIDPIVFSKDCGCIVAGKIKFVKDETLLAIVDYGDGECGGWATKTMFKHPKKRHHDGNHQWGDKDDKEEEWEEESEWEDKEDYEGKEHHKRKRCRKAKEFVCKFKPKCKPSNEGDTSSSLQAVTDF